MRSISVLAVAVATTFVMPSQLPSSDNGFSIWAGAKATELNPPRVRRYNGSRGHTVLIGTIEDAVSTDFKDQDRVQAIIATSESNGDNEPASAVDIVVSYIDELGNLASLETKKPPIRRWTHVALTHGAKLSVSGEINFAVTHKNKAIDVKLTPSPVVGEVVSEQIGKTNTFADVILLEDGRYEIGLGGSPKDMDKYCPKSKKGGDLCVLSELLLNINGEDVAPSSVENYWVSDLKGVKAGDMDGQTYFISATAYNDIGRVLDKSTTSGALNTEKSGRSTNEMEFIDLGINNKGELELTVANEPLDPVANSALSANFVSEDFGINLIDESNVTASPYRGFTSGGIEFIDSGNVIDMTYVFETEILDGSGNILAAGKLRGVVGSEFVEDKGVLVTCCLFEEPFEGPSPENIDVYGSFVQNLDEETFTFYFGVEGEIARQAAGVKLRVTPDDGGSDLDNDDVDGDPETLVMDSSVFLNLWDVRASTGDEASELFLASEVLSYSLSMSSNGKTQDIIGGLDNGSKFRGAEPFKGKGVRFTGDVTRRKAGKATSK